MEGRGQVESKGCEGVSRCDCEVSRDSQGRIEGSVEKDERGEGELYVVD